jgi:Asp-tRNA(Asn)/Glu-tRNA(Gln) amidotransferase A subunit family amidase
MSSSTDVDLGALDVTELRGLIAARVVSVREVVAACLRRIDEREEAVQAWEALDPEHALREADLRDAQLRDATYATGALHGIPVGIKDVFDTADFPTAYGSALYAGHRPTEDAHVVTALQGAGAVIVGKTVTTEFAWAFAPARTRNPFDPARTPGGSSSGSAAAVADGMVALAFGTQTAGSVIRPAAYCGIAAFKPSFGRWDRRGAMVVSPTLDTVGALARSVRDLRLVDDLLGAPQAEPAAREAPLVGVLDPPEMDRAEPATRAALQRARELLAGGTQVLDRTLQAPLDGAAQAQAIIMDAEMADSLAADAERAGDAATAALLAITDPATRPSASDVQAARALTERCRAALPTAFDGCDVLVAPAATGEAPDRSTTGDPVFCRAWTLLGCPAVAIPGLRGPAGLPVGLQVVGPPGSDRATLAAAAWVAARLAPGDGAQRASGAASA